MRVCLSILTSALLCIACDQGAPAQPRTLPTKGAKDQASVEGSQPSSEHPAEVRFVGMCDASGAVPLNAHRFVVADDEDNVLRVYDADRGGEPLYSKDISADVGLFPRPSKKPNRAPKPPAEADIEAATLHQGHAYWLTSHGTSSKGKHRPERLRFFATTRPDDGEMFVVGRAYTHLVADLDADLRYRPFALAKAAKIAPKEPGGLNIEGMTDRVEGGVFIGLRNPTPRGRALVVVLKNPSAVVEGEAAQFGDPLLLDLDGFGIRGLSEWRGRYWIAAGDHAGSRGARLYTWDGQSDRPQRIDVDLATFNPEGFFTPEDRDQFMLLSDDGTVDVDGTPCKKLKDASQKSFRGRWVRGVPDAKGSQ